MPPNPPEQTPEVKTPRTDAERYHLWTPTPKGHREEQAEVVDADFARTLERENAQLRAELEETRKDKERLDWLEQQAKDSPTGISFDWCRYAEEGRVLEHGFRFMRRHFHGERKKTIRAAIDAAALERKGAQGK